MIWFRIGKRITRISGGIFGGEKGEVWGYFG